MRFAYSRELMTDRCVKIDLQPTKFQDERLLTFIADLLDRDAPFLIEVTDHERGEKAVAEVDGLRSPGGDDEGT